MHNNVVLALALGLAEEGFVTLRFNFRGVGESEGEHGQGESEYEEVLGALDLIKAWPDTHGKTGLVGYSFGSGVILRHETLYPEADAVTLVSPGLRYITGSPLKSRKLPCADSRRRPRQACRPRTVDCRTQDFPAGTGVPGFRGG